MLTPLDGARETEAETGSALTLLLASSTGSRVIALSFSVLQDESGLLLNEARGNGMFPPAQFDMHVR